MEATQPAKLAQITQSGMARGNSLEKRQLSSPVSLSLRDSVRKNRLCEWLVNSENLSRRRGGAKVRSNNTDGSARALPSRHSWQWLVS